MDGKVEISVLQWENLREESKRLLEENKRLKEEQKQVKVVTVDKQDHHHLQYNYRTNRNELVNDYKWVESIEFVNFDKISNVLKGELREELKQDLNRLESENRKVNDELRKFNSEKESKLREVSESLEEKYRDKIKELEDKLIDKEEKNKEDILLEKIDKLEKENKELYDKLPWWKTRSKS